MDFQLELKKSLENKKITQKYYDLLLQFYTSYKQTLSSHQIAIVPYVSLFIEFLKRVEEQIEKPFSFQPYHKQILAPFNHYQFGIDLVRPLIDLKSSTVKGFPHLDEIEKKLEAKENVIFLANHQIEADPQVISILLEDKYPRLAQEMIFVAGERVLTDPLAAPFSMGRNLLCIYSKRYIDHPPELKTKKQMHNKKTMELMSALLCEGGHCIYVAPSGGRDRADLSGNVQVAPFDPQSIEMFYLMTQRASKPSSFYPMSLFTYNLLPPPETILVELGEERKTQRETVHLTIGSEIQMENIPGLSESDKRKKRELRAHFIWSEVLKEYMKFPITHVNRKDSS